jgi:hypothetical protein
MLRLLKKVSSPRPFRKQTRPHGRTGIRQIFPHHPRFVLDGDVAAAPP